MLAILIVAMSMFVAVCGVLAFQEYRRLYLQKKYSNRFSYIKFGYFGLNGDEWMEVKKN